MTDAADERQEQPAPYDSGKGAAYIAEPELEAALDVLRRRSLFRYYGPDMAWTARTFEQRLAERLGVAHVVGVSSGTAALHCGLVGLGIEEGDEVIIPAVTFIATVGAVVQMRAVPVFAEVDESLCLDPEALAAAITDKTRAVIPVHLANAAADMDPILAVARRHGIAVLEDAAQAIGVRYRGRAVGALGDAAAFSLQLDKNITSGEGGALATDRWEVYDRAVRFQDQGGQFTISTGDVRDHTSGEPFIGTNLRMTELAGAIAGAQLDRLDEIVARSRAAAHHIRARLSDLPVDWRRIPDPAGEGGSVTMFLADAEQAAAFAGALRAQGIPAGQVYGGRPVYLNPAILARRTPWSVGCPWHCAAHPTDRDYYPGLCPRSEDLLARSLSIPVGPRLTEADVDRVVRCVRAVAERLL